MNDQYSIHRVRFLLLSNEMNQFIVFSFQWISAVGLPCHQPTTIWTYEVVLSWSSSLHFFFRAPVSVFAFNFTYMLPRVTILSFTRKYNLIYHPSVGSTTSKNLRRNYRTDSGRNECESSGHWTVEASASDAEGAQGKRTSNGEPNGRQPIIPALNSFTENECALSTIARCP